MESWLAQRRLSSIRWCSVELTKEHTASQRKSVVLSMVSYLMADSSWIEERKKLHSTSRCLESKSQALQCQTGLLCKSRWRLSMQTLDHSVPHWFYRLGIISKDHNSLWLSQMAQITNTMGVLVAVVSNSQEMKSKKENSERWLSLKLYPRLPNYC